MLFVVAIVVIVVVVVVVIVVGTLLGRTALLLSCLALFRFVIGLSVTGSEKGETRCRSSHDVGLIGCYFDSWMAKLGMGQTNDGSRYSTSPITAHNRVTVSN